MRLPAALAPLRHTLFRSLWLANVTVSLGVWMQSTTAGWMMTSLSPNALMVSLVQAATVLPVFLFVLPAGALADIIDRKRLLLSTQSWMLLSAATLTGLTFFDHMTAWTLLALIFSLGTGIAMNGPAWGTVMVEAVPRADLVQAVALNGVGFNIARAVGPALGGLLLLAAGPSLTFGLNAISYLAVIGVLIRWKRPAPAPSANPPEHLLGAMKSGLRFVRHTPTVLAAMARAATYFVSCSALWATLPLVVRLQLGLGAGSFGMLLGLMGVGGVTAGLLLPNARVRFKRGQIVFYASLLSCAGMGLMSVSRHWAPAALAMLMVGVGWVMASSVAQASAQMAAPAWVRSRALSVYQLSFNLALVLGTFFWGWLATQVSLSITLGAAAGFGAVTAVLARLFNIDTQEGIAGKPVPPSEAPKAEAEPESVAPALATVLSKTRGRVMESQHYHINPQDKDRFLHTMAELRDVRGRGGAVLWHLGEDVSDPEHWVELWWVENWTDHLREASRHSDADREVLARALAFHNDGNPPPTRRFLAVTPHRAHGTLQ